MDSQLSTLAARRGNRPASAIHRHSPRSTLPNTAASLPPQRSKSGRSAGLSRADRVELVAPAWPSRGLRRYPLHDLANAGWATHQAYALTALEIPNGSPTEAPCPKGLIKSPTNRDAVPSTRPQEDVRTPTRAERQCARPARTVGRVDELPWEELSATAANYHPDRPPRWSGIIHPSSTEDKHRLLGCTIRRCGPILPPLLLEASPLCPRTPAALLNPDHQRIEGDFCFKKRTGRPWRK